jgi:hypothetical protein
LHHLKSLNVRHFGVIDVTFSVITSIQHFNGIHQLVQTLSGGFHPPQKFKLPAFSLALVTLNCLTSIQNFIQIQQSFQNVHHLRSLNVRRFGMIEATGLCSIKKTRSPSMSSPHTKFQQNPPNGSKVIKVFLYTQLRSLNFRHFGMAEATR